MDDYNNLGEGAPVWDQRQLYNKRIHELLTQVNFYSVEGDGARYLHAVRALGREISGSITVNEYETFLKLLVGTRRPKLKGVNEYYYDIDRIGEAEVYIRRLLDKVGLLMPRRGDPGQAGIDDI